MSAQGTQGIPVFILKEGTGRSTGKDAQRNTTTAVLLSGELLGKAEKLLDKDVHPTVIVDGYKKAAEKAIEILEKLSIPIGEKDDVILRQVAMTSMYSKGIVVAKEKFAEIAVKAVKQVAEKTDGGIRADIDLIKILKKHGRGLEETELVRGIVVDKEFAHAQMPKTVTPARIALLNAKLEIEKTEFDAKININSPE